jgi:signal transduction histidine kinase/DNA-binding response OmpR family regulator
MSLSASGGSILLKESLHLMNLSIRVKLVSAIVLAVVVVSGSASYVAFISVNTLSSRLRSVYTDSVLPLWGAEQASDELDRVNLNAYIALTTEGGEQQGALERLGQAQKAFELHFARYEKDLTIVTQPEMQALLRKYGALDDQNTREQNALEAVHREYPALQRALGRVLDLLRTGSRPEVLALYVRDLIPPLGAIDRGLLVLKLLQLEQAEYAERESQSLAKQAHLLIWVVNIIGVIAGVGLGLFFVSPISRGIRDLSASTRVIAAGDFGHQVHVRSRDELGSLADSFNDMVGHLAGARKALETATEAAQASSRAKSEFLAYMSHEIRTPMNGILGMTELALRAGPTPVQRDYLSAVKESGKQLLRIINDVLDFSKIEAGKLDLESIDFPLRDTLIGMLRPCALGAHEKGLELAYDVSGDVPDVLVGDPVRLRQVLVNLVGNAIKFTSEGEVVVQVRIEAIGQDRVCLHFAVRDTGIGIPADKQPLIFQAFAQADGSTTRKYGGSGLGLTISHRLVEAMGGRIWVESKVGEGSTFHFTVRFGRSHSVVVGALAVPSVQLRGLPVLVVDDNATNRRILQELLKGWHMKPTVAESGAAALAALAEMEAAGQQFRLVLLDCQMPEMDGFTLAEKIKDRYADVTIMMLTSLDQSGDTARCRELGINGYLVKPVSPSQLLDSITRALQPASQPKPCAVSPLVLPRCPQQPELRILLAEDNTINQVVAVEMLKELGHTVVVANDGKEALEALAREPFDLVLMDVQMPEMDGFKATAAIRAQETNLAGEPGDIRHQPIIAMTALAMKGDRERCLAKGMDGYVAKPIQREELLTAIAEVLVPNAAPKSRAPQLAAATPCAPLNGTSSPDLDRTAVLTRVGNNKERLRKLIGLFRNEGPRLLAAVQEAVGNRDAEAVERTAHSVKGAVANLGAVGAFHAATRLEASGRQGDLAAADQELTNLEVEVGCFQEALSTWDQEGLA